MQTKKFYKKGVYDKIVNDSKFNLGKREIIALERFLTKISSKLQNPVNIFHLGVGNDREISYFVKHIPNILLYLINDIVPSVANEVTTKTQQKFPQTNFKKVPGDIDAKDFLKKQTDKLNGQTLFVLTGNSVIFSNRRLDSKIKEAMKPGDLFLATLESPNPKMFDSYKIEPVYKFLSNSGLKVTAKNTQIGYDRKDQCLKMQSQGKLLLSAYKPKPKQLINRMKKSKISLVKFEEYKDINMIGALFTL